MKALVFTLLILLGIGSVLNTLEDHICDDSSAAETFAASGDGHGESLDHKTIPIPESEHEAEPCHFGHCTHANRMLAESRWDLLIVFKNQFPFHTYEARLLTGEFRFPLRPPAFS